MIDLLPNEVLFIIFRYVLETIKIPQYVNISRINWRTHNIIKCIIHQESNKFDILPIYFIVNRLNNKRKEINDYVLIGDIYDNHMCKINNILPYVSITSSVVYNSYKLVNTKIVNESFIIFKTIGVRIDGEQPQYVNILSITINPIETTITHIKCDGIAEYRRRALKWVYKYGVYMFEVLKQK